MRVFAIATLPSLITMIPDLSLEISTDAGSISLCFEGLIRSKGFGADRDEDEDEDEDEDKDKDKDKDKDEDEDENQDRDKDEDRVFGV